MTMIMYAANMMGMVKMDMSLMLGSLLGAERNSARVAGMVVHFMMGMAFGLIYAAIWYGLGISPTWYWGLLFGFIHGVIASAMLTMMSLMPATSQLATASGGGHGGSSSGSASLSGETCGERGRCHHAPPRVRPHRCCRLNGVAAIERDRIERRPSSPTRTSWAAWKKP